MANEGINENNKVGIVTLYHANYNFGGLLQAYALPKVLKEHFGIEAEQIDYVPTVQSVKEEQDNKKGIAKCFYQIIYNFGIFFFDKVNKKKLNRRKQAFDSFMYEIPHSESSYNYDSINKSINRYEVFLCGGDQIWNDCKEPQNIKVHTLQFVPTSFKKIAYAPSMAVLEASSSFKKVMRNGLNGLDAVSVREKKSLPVLQSLTDKNIEVVVDPVLLMTADEWMRLSRETKTKDKYILCYLLGDNTEQREAVEHFAKQLHLPILTFPYIFLNVVRKCDLFFGDIRDYSSGPREFIELIKNAEMVISDSFHACVFSMIFKTPFAVFERGGIGEKVTMNSRIYDFLEEYHLENQLVTAEELTEMKEIPKIDFTYAHEHWEKRRQESLYYLGNALKDNRYGRE